MHSLLPVMLAVLCCTTCSAVTSTKHAEALCKYLCFVQNIMLVRTAHAAHAWYLNVKSYNDSST